MVDVDFRELRRELWATVSHLRQVPDVVDFLQVPVGSDPETGMPNGVGWELWVNAPNDGPCLHLGLRGKKGTLEWWEPCGNIGYVPYGSEKRGNTVEYWWLGEPVPFTEGEETPIEKVWAAIGEFIATGKRPTIIQWMNRKDIPDYTPKIPFKHDPNDVWNIGLTNQT